MGTVGSRLEDEHLPFLPLLTEICQTLNEDGFVGTTVWELEALAQRLEVSFVPCKTLIHNLKPRQQAVQERGAQHPLEKAC